jgi:putative two-component system response regulator
VTLADVFDALTSERPYKRAWSTEEAVHLIEENAGVHFDPELIQPFKTVLPEILKIKEQYTEECGALTDMDL